VVKFVCCFRFRMENCNAANILLCQRSLRGVGAGCFVMSLSQMLNPRGALALMIKPSSLKSASDLHIAEPLLRWTGFFFLCLSTTMCWASWQPLPHVRGLLQAMGSLWLVDAMFVKWTVFRLSTVMNLQTWAIAGACDLGVGLGCLVLSQLTERAEPSQQQQLRQESSVGAKSGGSSRDVWHTDNLACWEERAVHHVHDSDSAYAYEIQAICAGDHALQPIDLQQFGDAVPGRSLLHLMCHIGTDTLGWRAHGAREVVGIDFSERAVKGAQELALKQHCTTGAPATFICCDIYDTPTSLTSHGHVPMLYDSVITSVGVLTWISNIRRWASVVSACLKPGGQFYIRDGHPAIHTLDENTREDARGGCELVLVHPYFEIGNPVSSEITSSYTGTATFQQVRKTHEWNHGLGETISALIEAGLQIDWVHEHTELDWRCPHTSTKVDGDNARFGGWMLPDHQRHVLPLMFSIRATKR